MSLSDKRKKPGSEEHEGVLMPSWQEGMGHCAHEEVGTGKCWARSNLC